MSTGKARAIAGIATAGILAALQVQPRNVPLLLVSALGFLIALWLHTRTRPGSLRVWMVLIVSSVGGVTGFITWLDIFAASDSKDLGAMVLAGASRGGAVAALAGLVLGLAQPSWWWRWGLMLSWAVVVMEVVDAQILDRMAALPFLSLPFLSAKTGEACRRYLPARYRSRRAVTRA